MAGDRSWLSDAVASYLGDAGRTDFFDSFPPRGAHGLRVHVAKPDYLLAMKLRAMRGGSRDEADAILLARAAGLMDREGLVALLRQYFPREELDPRTLVVVARFADMLGDAPRPEDP